MAQEQQWHFSPETVSFLNDLKANNNREWFMANKADFEASVQKPAEFFCMLMSERLQAMTGRPHTPKIFRVYRDVRFSKDKTPYNAHLHISFAPEGTKMPAYFFGLQPENLTLGAGTFGFDPGGLETYRHRVMGRDGGKLQAIIDTLKSGGYRLGEPALKKVPRGLPADHPRAELLRHKGLAAWYDFPDTSAATSGDAVTLCAGKFAQLQPLLNWLSSLS